MSNEPKVLERFLIAPGSMNYVAGDYGGYFMCKVENGTGLILEATLRIVGSETAKGVEQA